MKGHRGDVLHLENDAGNCSCGQGTPTKYTFEQRLHSIFRKKKLQENNTSICGGGGVAKMIVWQ